MNSISREQLKKDGVTVIYDRDDQGNIEEREEWDPGLTEAQITNRRGRLRKEREAEKKALKLGQKTLLGGILVRLLPIVESLAKGTEHEAEAKALAKLEEEVE